MLEFPIEVEISMQAMKIPMPRPRILLLQVAELQLQPDLLIIISIKQINIRETELKLTSIGQYILASHHLNVLFLFSRGSK